MNADNKNLLRLFVSRETLSRGENHALSEGQIHYLRNVMRLEMGGHLRAFNGRNGEWRAEVTELSKKKAIITFIEKIREQTATPELEILASPVKKEAFDFMVEKATELGATRFRPIICDHTVIHRANEARLQALSTEAAEQCERLDIMEITPLEGLANVLNTTWPADRKLIFCVERASAPPILSAVEAHIKRPLSILIGPEGGFSDSEVKVISTLPFAIPVSLGPRILRAETALIAAVACVQALRDRSP
ncbi:MAG: 16S rRNA (uracil(1498)-N(3))-methyltransferase [Alphaproteobacteria bacterium]